MPRLLRLSTPASGCGCARRLPYLAAVRVTGARKHNTHARPGVALSHLIGADGAHVPTCPDQKPSVARPWLTAGARSFPLVLAHVAQRRTAATDTWCPKSLIRWQQSVRVLRADQHDPRAVPATATPSACGPMPTATRARHRSATVDELRTWHEPSL